MKHIDARVFIGSEVFRLEVVRIAVHLLRLAGTDPQRREHVDDGRPLHQLNRARRVFRSASKQQIAPAMNHRRAYSGIACCRLQKISPIHVFPQRGYFLTAWSFSKFFSSLMNSCTSLKAMYTDAKRT